MIVPLTSRPELFTLFRVVDDSEVILLKKFDEGMNRLEGKITAETVASFVDNNSQPLIMEFEPKTSKKIFQGFQASPNLILFFSWGTEKFQSYIESMKKVAKAYVGDIRFVSVDTDIEDNIRIMESLFIMFWKFLQSFITFQAF